MPPAVMVTRTEYTAADLRREAGRARDGNAARRMLAIAHVLEGASRDDAARTCGMDRQTLRDWVHRFNGQCLAGLSNDNTKGGRRARLRFCASRVSTSSRGSYVVSGIKKALAGLWLRPWNDWLRGEDLNL